MCHATPTVISVLVMMSKQITQSSIPHPVMTRLRVSSLCDVIMGTMAYQITSLTIVYSTVYSGADQRNPQSSPWLAFVRGIHRWPVNSPHKWWVTRKMLPFDDVIMLPANLVKFRRKPWYWLLTWSTLQQRHYGCHGVSHHLHRDCLLNHLFKYTSKKTSKLSDTVRRKMFPFDDVIMYRSDIWQASPQQCCRGACLPSEWSYKSQAKQNRDSLICILDTCTGSTRRHRLVSEDLSSEVSR